MQNRCWSLYSLKWNISMFRAQPRIDSSDKKTNFEEVFIEIKLSQGSIWDSCCLLSSVHKGKKYDVIKWGFAGKCSATQCSAVQRSAAQCSAV